MFAMQTSRFWHLIAGEGRMTQAANIHEVSAAECERNQDILTQLLSPFFSKIPEVKVISTLKKWRYPRDLLPEDQATAVLLDMFLQFAVMNHLAFDKNDAGLSFLDRQLRLAKKSASKAEVEFLVQLQKGARFCGPIIDHTDEIIDMVCIDDKISNHPLWIYSPGLLCGDEDDYLTGFAFKFQDENVFHHTTAPAFWLPRTLSTGAGELNSLLDAPTPPSDLFWQKLLRRYFKQDFPLQLDRRFSKAGRSSPSPDLFEDFSKSEPFGPAQTTETLRRIRLDPSDPVENCILEWRSEGNVAARDRLRLYASLDVLIYVLQLHLASEESRQLNIATASKEALFILAETLIARDSAGIMTRNASTAQIRERVSDFIIKGDIPQKGLKIIEEINKSVGQSQETKRTSDNPEVAKVISRIEALEMRTTDRGFSEQEAYLAAQKLADLLDRYGSELEDQTIVEYPTEAIRIETARKRMAPVHHTVHAVAAFCDCKHWIERGTDSLLTLHVFGLRQDSYAAQALFDLIQQMFKRERQEFQESEAYQMHDRGGRKAALHAFEHGLATRITLRLREIKQTSREKLHSSTGRDLVLLKDQKIEEDLELLGLDFQFKSLSRSVSDMEAFEEGFRRGEDFDI